MKTLRTLQKVTSNPRRIVHALLVASMAAGLALSIAPAANAAVTHHIYRTCSTPGGCGTFLRSGPAKGASHLGLMSDGDAISVVCWGYGDSEYGNNVWLNGVWKGVRGWAMDYYVDTHWRTTSDLTNQGIPQCGATPAPQPAPAPGGGVNGTQRSAINWARARVGQNSYHGLCLAFVTDAYGQAGRNLRSQITVPINSNTYPSDIWGHFNAGRTGTGTPPAGALVFYLPNSGRSKIYSHVTLSIGSGTEVSTADTVNERVIHYESTSQHDGSGSWSHYVGWWLPAS